MTKSHCSFTERSVTAACYLLTHTQEINNRCVGGLHGQSLLIVPQSPYGLGVGGGGETVTTQKK